MITLVVLLLTLISLFSFSGLLYAMSTAVIIRTWTYFFVAVGLIFLCVKTVQHFHRAAKNPRGKND
jgi:hypothetical protein